MKPASAGSRRHLPTSPFKPAPPPSPPEEFVLDDQVSHDQYGLGVVVEIAPDAAVLVDFRTRREWIRAPYTKLYKL
ncbi:hypothetical protein JOL79_07385 [Microbispora sp. RL4-1S]|uniref:Uncharacterized protein n=1 Tax=Microbispora oryzae TaxID=2806554 RepID=A0A940WDU3_9ACTN|nr:hypothetical protein [Microbispora oryzae]MBP2703621.1 hypothetical protein [Microbispora oryzae]